MKVLHIGNEITGGAGLAMNRIHRCLVSKGIDSKVLCLKRGHSALDERIYGFLDDERVDGKVNRNLLAAALNRLHIYSTPYYKAANDVGRLQKHHAMVSSPYSCYRVDQAKLVEEVDIVHLHWVANFIDYPTFFSKVRKPIVWTLHDENPAIGYWHCRVDIPKTFSQAERDTDNKILKLKAQYMSQAKSLHLVSLSAEYDKWFSTSTAFCGRQHYVIPNSVDGDVFQRHGRSEIRKIYGISDSDKVLVFAVQGIGQRRKGLHDLFEAMSILKRDDIVIICIGQGELPPIEIPNRIIRTGKIEDLNLLSAFLSAGDLFVAPSLAETFGQTLVEALACGLPVVSYPNSGAKDIVTAEDGVLCNEFSVEALVAALTEALSKEYDTMDLRNRVLTRFSPEKVAQCYINLYESIMNK